ncbi:unnamed protein product [Brachionus calyciflorus]|uniref:Uncharacterized protein n=1 Tax=Brachionus calyciflorus TaxID=104777 RepID=A0A813PNR2_9BILA|nr:unnamed protein product [Brachionus calyciflorus]
MDSDATIVLIISLLITFVNVVFISSIFVFFCCCIDVVDQRRRSKSKNEVISADNDIDFEQDKLEEQEESENNVPKASVA